MGGWESKCCKRREVRKQKQEETCLNCDQMEGNGKALLVRIVSLSVVLVQCSFRWAPNPWLFGNGACSIILGQALLWQPNYILVDLGFTACLVPPELQRVASLTLPPWKKRSFIFVPWGTRFWYELPFLPIGKSPPVDLCLLRESISSLNLFHWS